jgi:hypothetical protein
MPVRPLFFWLLSCTCSLAAPVSQAYLCVQGHEQDATTKMQTFIRQAVTEFFKDRRIAINPTTLQINLGNSTQAGADAPAYLSFTGNAPAGSSALTASSVAATVAAQDGTKFNVLLSSGSDNQDAAEYRIIRTQRGFDREGNAVGQHCTLRLFSSGDIEATKGLLVVNAASGHPLGRIRLPSVITLY